ncbi:hypothetical protein [Kribbella amoyensis]|uniref:hypothetical protein n=1 Tax=Kribbella amoyensis TaxID=996641 RepID=UPI0011A73F23|nr:hypothetical protein [Kribbella amoyensis]
MATLGTIGVAAPSAQAAETAAIPFRSLTYGASYYSGSVSFSNRSVSATGILHSVSGSGCRFASVTPYVGSTEYPTYRSVIYCNGASGTVTVGAPADVPGGPSSVVVGLWTYDPATDTATLVRTTKPIAR